MIIKWVADQREIPGFGLVSKGDIKEVPDHLGKSFVTQGLAVKSKPQTKEVK